MENKTEEVVDISYFTKNQKFWTQLPAGGATQYTDILAAMDDEDFRDIYQHFMTYWDQERDWEYERYGEMFKGKNVVEIGSGLGYDGNMYSKTASTYTFCDINLDQLNTVKRVSKLFNKGAFSPLYISNSNHSYQLIEDPLNHNYKTMFDALYSHGVLHHVPFEVAHHEFKNVDKFLKVGAKVVLLMYPKIRWENAGCPDPTEFGSWTDPGCPWSDWYDEERIIELVGDHYTLDDTIYWGLNNEEFVNFELTKTRERVNNE